MAINPLTLRKRLTLWEASGLLNGVNRDDACALMREAVEDGDLAAFQMVTHGEYVADLGTFAEGGAVDVMQTVVERVEFDRWRNLMGMTAEASPEVGGEPEAKPAPQAAPVVQTEVIDLSMLADPGQLIAAFGRHTNMDASWFANWKDYAALKNAIKRKGTSGRGHTTEPLFCPFLVMQGLMKTPRKGSKRQSFKEKETPWRLLKRHFPSVYDMHQGLSPLND